MLVAIIGKNNAQNKRAKIRQHVMQMKKPETGKKYEIADDGRNAAGNEKTFKLNNAFKAKKSVEFCFKGLHQTGDPNGIRTRISTVKGWHPNH